MTKQTEALKMAHKSFMQLNERYPRRDNGDGYFDKEILACKEALEQPAQESVALKFPTMLRKMWSGGEVQEWLDKQQSLYTQPATSWQGLSDDEIWNIANFLGKNKEWDYPVMFAKTIEKSIKEKNT